MNPFLLISLFILLIVFATGAYIIKWRAYIWLGTHIRHLITVDRPDPGSEKHVVFVMVDHYEPGRGEKGEVKCRTWLDQYCEIASRHLDSYGNRFQYSWFYPFDQRNEGVLRQLSQKSFEGYGEVEFHWHHPTSNNDEYPAMVDEAVKWFGRYGCFLTPGPKLNSNFAFIHGNWALDDSNYWYVKGEKRGCGVTLEMEILKSKGCFADFTFPAFGMPSQPAMANSIYYAKDTPEPKSYNRGTPATVGKSQNDDLMIFTGPLGFNFNRLKFEYGAMEFPKKPGLDRIRKWFQANIHVQGRPEWIFIKVFTHGIQYQESLFQGQLDAMLEGVKEIARDKDMKLHFMTAREAYNVVKAAEDGKQGNPEDYRNYKIGQPCARLINTPIPIEINQFSPDTIEFLPEVFENSVFRFKNLPLKKIEGTIKKVYLNLAQKTLYLEAEGDVKVHAAQKLGISGHENIRISIEKD